MLCHLIRKATLLKNYHALVKIATVSDISITEQEMEKSIFGIWGHQTHKQFGGKRVKPTWALALATGLHVGSSPTEKVTVFKKLSLINQ